MSLPRTRILKESTMDDLADWSGHELCCLYANAHIQRIREGGASGEHARLYTLIKRRVNAEFRRRRK